MDDLRTRTRAVALDAASVGLLAFVALPAAAMCLAVGAVTLATYTAACAAGVRAHDLRTGYRTGRVLWSGGHRR